MCGAPGDPLCVVLLLEDSQLKIQILQKEVLIAQFRSYVHPVAGVGHPVINSLNRGAWSGVGEPPKNVCVVGVESRDRGDGQINVTVSKVPQLLRDNYL